jgi:predicted outer membrane protein
MKLISSIIALLLLIASVACSKEENKPEPAAQKAVTDIIKTETISINNAKKALEDSKQVNQMIQDSAAQQRETIDKTQQ